MITLAALVWFLWRGSVVITLGYGCYRCAVKYGKIESPSMRQWACAVILSLACCPWSVPVQIAYKPSLESTKVDRAALSPISPLTNKSEAMPLSEQTMPTNEHDPAELLASHIAQHETTPSLDFRLLAMHCVTLLWPLGVLGYLVIGIVRYAAFFNQVSCTGISSTENHQAWQVQWQALLSEQGIKARVPFVASEEHGPMLAWLVRGYRLIVPQQYWQSLSVAERRGILLHELAHYLRSDIFSACAMRLLALPFWFHPLAWRLVTEFDEAAEWACDRAVLEHGEPLAYAKALERLVDSHLPNFSLAMGRCAQSHPLVSRVRRVLNPVPNEDSLMNKFLFSATLGAVALLALVNIRLVAQDQVENQLKSVLEDAKRIEAKLSVLKDAAEKTKAAAQELKSRVDEHLEKLQSLAKSPELSADGKHRIEMAQAGEEAKQLQAVEGAEKLGDEGLLICAYLAQQSNSETVRRKALTIACSLGEAGLPVLAHAFESLVTKDRLFLIEQLAKADNEINRMVLARVAQDDHEEVSSAAISAGMKMKEPINFLALVGDKNQKVAGVVLDQLSKFSSDDQLTLLFASAIKGPEENLPKTIQTAAKLKSPGYPVIAAAYKRSTPEARAEIVRVFRKSSEPIEQRVVQEALKDGDATLREAAEKANAE